MVMIEPGHLRIIESKTLSEQEISCIQNPRLREALKKIDLNWSVSELLNYLGSNPDFTKLIDNTISNSQFCSGKYSVLAGRTKDVNEIYENVAIANRMELKCSPKVALFKGLQNPEEGFLVLEWPSEIVNFSRTDDLPPATKEALKVFSNDMQKLAEIGVFHEYGLIGSAHRYMDRTGQYPFIVLDVWNCLKSLAQESEEIVRNRIERILK